MSNDSVSALETTRNSQPATEVYASVAFATECSQVGQPCAAAGTGANDSVTSALTAADTYAPSIHPRFETINSTSSEQIRRQRAEKALDTASDGEKLLQPDPPLPNKFTPALVDKRLAQAEKWLHKTLDFFSDHCVMRLLSPEELAATRVTLQNCQTAITDFKALLEEYRSRGEQPPINEIKAAFAKIRAIRGELKFVIATVVVRAVQVFEQTIHGCLIDRSYDQYVAVLMESASVLADFQLILNDMAVQTHNDSRNDRLCALLRWALFLLRENRAQPLALGD
jgi:hypothetical protein